MKKFIFLVTLAVFFSLMSSNAMAAATTTGSKATGAKIPNYQSVVTITISEEYIKDYKNEYYAIQAALNKARDNASTKTQYKIIIPKGTYYVDSTLKIYSNTYLQCQAGTVLKMKPNSTNGNILRGGTNETYEGYTGLSNIIVEGGTWDNSELKGISQFSFSNIRFAHITNLYLKNMDVRYNRSGHHMEFAAASGITVERCTLSGYEGTSGKEAIQIDISNKKVFAAYPGYDNLPCKNVLVKNSTFNNVSRGVGAHSAIAGVYHKEISIVNNTFTNIERQAIMAINLKNCTISGNKISKSGAGIEFKYFSDTLSASYIPIKGQSYNHDSNANTIIKGNTISTIENKEIPSSYAIRSYGDTYKGTYIPKGNYYITNMLIADNIIKNVVGGGICLNGTYASQVVNNTISNVKIKHGNSSSKGIFIVASKSIGVTKNKISSVNGYGLAIVRKSSNIKIKSNNVVGNTTYDYSVNADSSAVIDGVKRNNYRMYSAPGKVEKLTVKAVGNQAVTIHFSKALNAKSYEIYESTSKTGSYKKVKTIDVKTLKVKLNKRKKGKTYYYKVVATRTANKKTIQGQASKVVGCKVK